jgi:nitroreductase
MYPEKYARTIFPLNNLLKTRWSPRAFLDKPVDKDKLKSLFEAARWSPSAGNLQPWRFIVGINGDETWLKIFNTLDEGNKVWVKPVPVLVLTVGEKAYHRKNRVIQNGYYGYDTGQAVAHLTVEATYRGLHVHQMGGFDPERTIREFNIPQDYQPLTVIALGYIADPSSLPPDLKKRELAERKRKDFDELVFSDTFGHKSNLLL